MSSCGNCKFKEWCSEKAEDITWCIEKSHLNIAYEQGRADAIGEIATKLEQELTMVMPKDKVKFVMYKVHTVLEKIKEHKK